MKNTQTLQACRSLRRPLACQPCVPNPEVQRLHLLGRRAYAEQVNPVVNQNRDAVRQCQD